MKSRSVIKSLMLAVLAATALGVPARAQLQGSLTGRVTDAATGQPIPLATVSIVGTALGAQTNGQGQYTIRGINAGKIEVRVLRVGFAEKRGTINMSSGQAATLDLTMSAVATTLSPVVTTVTGEQRRVEVGNSIAQVDAGRLKETTAIGSVGDLLTARTPGVMVVPGTQIGAGTRVRVRGTSSLSLSNNPIYIIDGTRVEGTTGSSTVSVGGTTPARVNDINPEEIETIEVVRGPSAATLYGTDAANGVIVITTKRGVAGKMQTTYTTEQGARVDRNHYPDAYRAWRSGATAALTSTSSNVVQCFLSQVTANACKQDSVTKFNLYDDPETTPNGTGYRQQHSLQVGGGSEQLRYFLHGEWENDAGILKVPEFDKRYLIAHGATLRSEELSPSNQGRKTMRGNFNIAATPSLDFAFNTGYTSQDTRLPTSDDSGTLGVAANTYGGPGQKYNLAANGDTLWGWRQFTPRDIYQTYTNQGISRLISSLNTNWRAAEWLSARANVGLDYANRLDTQLCRFGSCPDLGGDSRKGYKIDNRSNFFTYASDASATATKAVSSTMMSKTTAGVQFNRSEFDRNGASGTQLPPGAVSVTAGAVKSADESTSDTRTLGGFVEEAVSFNERLFLTGALRSDRNSAFGADFKTVLYPKLSASWVVSEEGFFPKYNWMNQLRLRSAYGASGVQPGTIDAVQYFSASTTRLESGDAPAVVFSTLGNVNLKPERSTELEMGIDGTFFDSRLTTELTYYQKASRDALISRILPPSLGTGATSRFENLGKVSNVGWEFLLNAQMVQRSAFGWDLTVSANSNTNTLDSLGGLPNIISSSTAQQREGKPLNGWWSRALVSYADKNGDGIIAYNVDPNLSEVVVTDTAVYLGNPIPKYELSVTNGFDFLKRRLHFGGMVDYKGGFKTYNNTERIRCGSRNNCAGLLDPHASLFEQARTVAQRDHPAKTVAGFIEDGDFIRLRELNVTYTASEDFASRFLHGRRIAATFAARNLGILWTKYTGVDPEAFATTGDAPSEFQAFGPTTFYVFRLSFGF
ncbi:MAG: TonB-dependent outer membrane protein SusC/RagA [Gemmatimonadetes bacterium]|nr:TonB-dependent outer membrane protein SusC/RagA [Gemmatimonadota bacterium]